MKTVGAKPPPAVKFAGWNDRLATTTIVSNGTSVFQMTTIELLSAMKLAPARFITVNSTMPSVATMRPLVLSTDVSPLTFNMAKLLIDPMDAVHIRDRGEDLDGSDRDCLQPRRPACDKAGERTVE